MIARGLRINSPSALNTFQQWTALADLLRRLDINVFLDVGANKGFFSTHVREIGYGGHLFSFEPIASDCDHIRRLAAGDPKWTVLQYGLGAETKKSEFNVSSFAQQTVLSSLLPRAGGNPPDVRSIQVDLHRLDEVLPALISDISAPRVFLKMDTQGFDGQVIDGAAGILDKILGLQSEVSVVPQYEGAPPYTKALAKYHELGFELLDLFVVNRTDSGGVLEYDCVMLRKQS